MKRFEIEYTTAVNGEVLENNMVEYNAESEALAVKQFVESNIKGRIDNVEEIDYSEIEVIMEEKYNTITVVRNTISIADGFEDSMLKSYKYSQRNIENAKKYANKVKREIEQVIVNEQ